MICDGADTAAASAYNSSIYRDTPWSCVNFSVEVRLERLMREDLDGAHWSLHWLRESSRASMPDSAAASAPSVLKTKLP